MEQKIKEGPVVKQEGFRRRGTHVREAEAAGFGCLVRSGDGTLMET